MTTEVVKSKEQFIELCEQTSIPYGVVFELGCDGFIKFMDDFMDVLSRVVVVDNGDITCRLVSVNDGTQLFQVSRERLDERHSEDWWRDEILMVMHDIAKRPVASRDDACHKGRF